MASEGSTTHMPRKLVLYEDFTREEVHQIFSPETSFTPQSGTWGLQGIVPIPDREGDFVFFVTFGTTQGEHTFEEGVSTAGLVTWQSQPRNKLTDQRIQSLIRHDSEVNSIYLFLRTATDKPYTFLGRLKYIIHDLDREEPVFFKWQILDWALPEAARQRMGITLVPDAMEPHEEVMLPSSGPLVEEPPPERSTGSGLPTPKFKAKKSGDHAARDARNRTLGKAGELLVLEHERKRLEAAGQFDLASKVLHIADIEGDGAGYDVRSFELDGRPRFIEVKTTRGGKQEEFYVSQNEIAFSKHKPSQFYLYRVFNYGLAASASFFIMHGPLDDSNFWLTPTQFRVKR